MTTSPSTRSATGNCLAHALQESQSDNPRGRPRGAKNFSTLLTDALNEPVVVTKDGRRGVLTGAGADIIVIDGPLKPEERRHGSAPLSTHAVPR